MSGPLLHPIEAEMNCVISGGSRNGYKLQKGGGRQPIIRSKFSENCRKLKKIELGVGERR